MRRNQGIACIGIAGGLLLLSVAAWAGPEGKNVGNRYQGTLTNIVAGTLTIAVTSKQPPNQTFTIAKDVQVLCRRGPCSLADLTPGTAIKVRTAQRGDATIITEIKEARKK